MMTCCSRVRHALVPPSATLAAAGALTSAGVVAAPAMAASYPPPGGIYAPFTDCPIKNRILRQSAPNSATGCIASVSTSGSFTINGIPVAITHPVIVQFGVWSDLSTGNQVLQVVPTRDKNNAMAAEREVIPNGVVLLGCSGGDRAVADLCQKAMSRGQTDLSVQVKIAGPITDFMLTTFTLPVKISLGNPLLGKCSIGSDKDPVVLHPSITSGNLAVMPDPDP